SLSAMRLALLAIMTFTVSGAVGGFAPPGNRLDIRSPATCTRLLVPIRYAAGFCHRFEDLAKATTNALKKAKTKANKPAIINSVTLIIAPITPKKIAQPDLYPLSSSNFARRAL